MTRCRTWTACVWTLATLGIPWGAAAQAPADPAAGDLTRDQEIRLAMSAGPPAVSEDADVWVMGTEGYERALTGSNGFACIVERIARAPGVLAPHCLSPAAVRTVLPAMLLEGELIQQGRSAEEVRAAIERAFDEGDLELPSGPAYAYMMSSGQRLGRAGNWKPHVMFYMPYATNEQVGGDPSKPEFPFVGPVEGGPLSTLVVVSPQFVDPEDIRR